MKAVKRATCSPCRYSTDTAESKSDKNGLSVKLKCPKCGKPLKLSNQWYVRGQHNGKAIFHPCGPLKKDAEAYMATITVAIHSGNPLPQKEQSVSWQLACEKFVEHNAVNVKPATQKFYQWNMLPLTDYFRDLSLQQITSDLVIAYKHKRLESVAGTTVNHELTTLNRIFAVALKHYSPRQYPNLMIAAQELKNVDAAKEIPKTRNLTMGEIKTVWNNLYQLNESVANALKLILLTGQRPGEVAGICPEEIEGNWWTIPADRSKNGLANRVYMTQTALSLANGIHITRSAVSKAIKRLETDSTVFGVKSFTPHDLRRTMATRCSEMGYSDEVIDAVLNHAKQGVIKIYNQNKYDAAKKELLIAWERRVLDFVSGETGVVVELRKVA